MNFTAFPRFYPTGSNPATDPALDPMGLNSNLLPLENNVTFFFNSSQGTIQTLYFFETIGGANISLVNVSLPVGTHLTNFSVDILFNTVSSETPFCSDSIS